MPQGTIKKLASERGFGFIETGGWDQLFFHRSAAQEAVFDALREGQQVEYEEVPSPKGPRTTALKPV